MFVLNAFFLELSSRHLLLKRDRNLRKDKIKGNASRANKYYSLFVSDLISTKYFKNINEKDKRE